MKPTPIRAVLDTKVLVSALLFEQGRLSWLRSSWRSSQVVPLLVQPPAIELLRVLAYPRFKLQPQERDQLLADVLPWCETWRTPLPSSNHTVRDADSGYDAAEQWLRRQGEAAIQVSHWLLVEVAGVVSMCVRRGELSAERAAAIHAEFECFRRERLQLLEPRASDFLQARAWLQDSNTPALRSGDALHLAIAQREQLTLALRW